MNVDIVICTTIMQMLVKQKADPGAKGFTCWGNHSCESYRTAIQFKNVRMLDINDPEEVAHT